MADIVLVVVDTETGGVVMDEVGSEVLPVRVIDTLVEFQAETMPGKATRAATATASEYLILNIELSV